MHTNIPVIIVDNEHVDRYIARRHFEQSHDFHVVREFESGDAFIDSFDATTLQARETASPTLVLMDISMPGKDGFETIRQFAQRAGSDTASSNVIFVIYTSSSSIFDREEAASVSALKGYYEKPLRSDHVSDLLKLCRRH
ncbi:MAG: response regulator [Pseudomonadota bacterium]